jgi:hypothetical protein
MPAVYESICICICMYLCKWKRTLGQVDSSDATEIAVALILVMRGDSILYIIIQNPTLLIAAYQEGMKSLNLS